ncbi:MAG: exodeoxyribonuclease III [Myxococcota bacterium]|nr:exodeoxyribonuclease III [Myxococcota bacterium]MEE2780527.1 exodeoxyribonuclease III [Myxococcota bacterium]
MRILSWNVNGLRACARKGFVSWLQNCKADIVALQETRARPDQLTPEVLEPPGWNSEISPAERPGYSGVGIYSRSPWDSVETSLNEERFDVEGRIQKVRFGELLIVNGYFPNGSGPNRDLSRIPYKLDFYRHLYDHLEEARAGGARILVLGDFNTAHRPIDLARPKGNQKTSGFRPEERDELDRWLVNGWTDTFRSFHDEGENYSWWSNRPGVRERNVGWRIDYVLASPGAMPFVDQAFILPEVMGSDHCPVGVDVKAEILKPA